MTIHRIVSAAGIALLALGSAASAQSLTDPQASARDQLMYEQLMRDTNMAESGASTAAAKNQAAMLESEKKSPRAQPATQDKPR